ncbi:hypothetical protein L3Q82_021925 [Scortum barcoo]|uniref:Uncharacterized protein n=1 Tax=Scortum barcoo TaxID=214431 RepID=A0ACB8X5X4_9TELE|nr:hypothetical protein L3Q82_021925 [Scortum barcoo]
MSPRWGEEPELVREVERYWLEIVGLTSMHSLGSGTQLLERGGSLPCAFGLGIGLLLLFVPMGQTAVQKYLAFLESLGGVLDSAPTGDFRIILLGDFNAHMGTTVIPGGA